MNSSLRTTFSTSLLISTSCIALLCGKAVAAESKIPEIEEVIVTGSRLPTAPDLVAVRVTTVGAEQIQRAGVNNDMLEILRKSVPAFQGRSNAGTSNANNTNQNTAGGAQVQLRNLDTLVLINGRRSAISGIAAIGGKAFVDANQIPASAIDHIEVLSDGSSAIYGSDAIGGVVNVILKSNGEGTDVGGRFGVAKGGYQEKSGYFNTGAKLGEFKLNFGGSITQSDPLYQNARPFVSPLTGRVSVVPGTIGGGTPAILADGLNSPSTRNPVGVNATAPSFAALIANGTYTASSNAGIAATYDLSQFQTFLQRQNEKALSFTFSGDLIEDKLSTFGDVIYNKRSSFTQFLPIANTVTVPAGAPFNPLTTAAAGVNFA